ncbi:penicillin-binding protein activator [Primorskyibacter flagellatus]|uniref:Amino acid/amide ABC transporter substrate-binding protein, HAAT family n=1 Tax=Primorskyibacter flagellatus TaxID=1387277 RepID=A0A1W2ASW5_9RHOB|nr:penicillin-binding protein activator [Primorskyibacter flagellatus]SMC63796.1 amino acid/amide ABC transporter substrate-binding protein, HAAT family [Primorskyibacter flagellatus]
MFAVFTPIRKALAKIAALASVIALAGCLPEGGVSMSGGGGQKIDPKAPIPVALLVPKSHSSAGAVGRSLENAARLAIADLNGVRIDLRVYDTAGDQAQSAALAQRAADEGAKIILGPLFADNAVAASNAVSDEGINVLAFSNNSSIAGGNLFILGPTFDDNANRLMGFAARQGKRSVVIVHPDNTEGTFGRNAIQRAASRNGVNVAAVESFPFSQQAVAAAAPRIAGTVNSTGADSVFLTSTPAGALPLLLQLLPEAGVAPASTQYLGLSRWDVPAQTLQLRGAQGGWFALPNQQTVSAFEGRYASAFGSAPHQLGGLAYDGIAAIGALASRGKNNALTRGALTQSAGFQGTSGVFRLKADGTNERGLAVATVRNNQLVILDPAPRSFGGAGF